MIRVVLPQHLRTLSGTGREVSIEVGGGAGAGGGAAAAAGEPVAEGEAAVPAVATQRLVLDALEAAYPMLRGTLRDPVTGRRRPFVRFFACEEDLSHGSPDSPLPEAVLSGAEPFYVVGAMAGG